MIDLGAGSEMLRAPVIPEPVPLPDGSPSAENPHAIKMGQTDRKWKVIPFAGLEISSTDNLFISATKRQSDFFATFSPGLAFGLGDYDGEIRQLGSYEHHFEPLELDPDDLAKNFIFARYNVNAFFYDKNTDQNSVNHDALISGRWEGAKLTIGARFYYQTLSDIDIEVGNRVDRTVYGGELSSKYSFGGKTSIEFNLSNQSYDYAKQLSWHQWMVEDWLNYQVLPKTKVSLGTRFGSVNVEYYPTQTFEQLVGRVDYFPSPKVGFSLNGGVEWRQLGGAGADAVIGVFNFTGTYLPFDGTLMAVTAYRRNTASILLSDANITATGFSILVRQRFLQRYFFAVEGGYEDADYRSRQAGAGSDRQDRTTYIKSGMSCDVTKNLSAEFAYQHRRNDSSSANLSFTENVFTFLFKLRF